MDELTIGCDPELGLTNHGQLKYASTLGLAVEQEFGADGCGRVAEIRPPFAKCPIQLTRNIKNVFQRAVIAKPELNNYVWKAGSIVCGEPIGGHIHFGHQWLMEKMPEDHARIKKYMRGLDNTLAVVGALLEDPIEFKERRLGSSYGRQGDYRSQRWGQEYRVLASWITSPPVASGVLSLAYALMMEMKEESFVEMTFNLPYTDILEDRESLLMTLPRIIKIVRGLKYYPKYQFRINYLLALLLNKKSWFPKKPMKEVWGIVSPAVQPGIEPILVAPPARTSPFSLAGEITLSSWR